MLYHVVTGVYTGVHTFIQILTVVLCVYALMTWFVRPDAPLYRWAYRFCSPIVAPFKPLSQRLIRSGLRVDLSVWMAIIALRILDRLLARLLFLLL